MSKIVFSLSFKKSVVPGKYLELLSYLKNKYFLFRGYEVNEALRVQMEVQSKLHLQVEVIFFLLQRSDNILSLHLL